jgi:hypothetical protein
MMRSALALLLVVAVISAGCAPPVFPTPPVHATSLGMDEAHPDLAEYFTPSRRIGKTDVYLAQWGGGTVALPLLLGLLGGIVDGLMINAKTSRMADAFAAGGTFDLQQRTMTALAAHDAFGGGADLRERYVVSPALVIQVDDDDKVRTALVFRTQRAPNGWVGIYFYHLDYMPHESVMEPPRLEEYFDGVAAELDAAFDTLSKVVVSDLAGQYTKGTPLLLKSRHFADWGKVPFPGVEIAEEDGHSVLRVDGKPGLILFPFILGIHVFRADQFEVVRRG